MAEKEPRERGRITKDLYDRLVLAYRELPGNSTHAARAAGCSKAIASRAWARGWSDERSMPRLLWARPIEKVINEEHAARRQVLEEEQRKKSQLDDEAYLKERREAYRKAQRDLHESRALIGKTVRASRQNAAGLLSLSARMIRSGLIMAKAIEDKINLGTEKLTIHEMRLLVRDVAFITKAATENAKATDEMERKALGEPDAFIVHAQAEGVNLMTEQQAAHEIQEAARALARAAERGTIDTTAIDVAKVIDENEMAPVKRYSVQEHPNGQGMGGGDAEADREGNLVDGEQGDGDSSRGGAVDDVRVPGHEGGGGRGDPDASPEPAQRQGPRGDREDDPDDQGEDHGDQT